MKIDKELIRKRFARSFPNYEGEAVVQYEIAEKLAEMVAKTLPRERVTHAMELGIGTGFLSRRLVAAYPDAEWFLNDIADEALLWLPKELKASIHPIIGDAETLAFPQQLQLIASASVLQWFQDVPAFMKKAGNALSCGGILAISTFGPKNFSEIRQVLGAGLAYPTLFELKDWAEKTHFRIVCAEEWQKTIFLPTPHDVLRHIKNTGVNAIRAEQWNRAKLANFSRRYTESHSAKDGSVSLSYNPIILLLEQVK